MSSSKNINIPEEDNLETLSDPKYLTQSHAIIIDSLKDGCDVLQMPNGDIILREQKVVATKYAWNPKKEKIVKLSMKIEDPNQSSLEGIQQ
jgi:hypothetical protein